jgi:hypothetical protein
MVNASAVVGVPEVFQHTPRLVIPELPMLLTFPPHLADCMVISVTSRVSTFGGFSLLQAVRKTSETPKVRTEITFFID